MNAFSFGEVFYKRVKSNIFQFVQNIQKLLRASPVFGGAIVLASVVLGFGPMLWWQFFHQFIDAAYGARGVGTLTSDLRIAAIWIGVLAALMAISITYLSQTKALARTIALTIVLWGIGATSVLALLPITKSFLLMLGVLAIAFQFAKHRVARVAIGALVFILTIASLYDSLLMMTHRSVSVGGMMEYAGAIVMLSLLVGGLNAKAVKDLVCV